jgi:hypothetical protein
LDTERTERTKAKPTRDRSGGKEKRRASTVTAGEKREVISLERIHQELSTEQQPLYMPEIEFVEVDAKATEFKIARGAHELG